MATEEDPEPTRQMTHRVTDRWIHSVVPTSAMAGKIAAFPWAGTSLGELETWGINLRAAVRTCLASASPMAVIWGPDLIQIFNDAYLELAGVESVSALGTPSREAWSDTWSQLETSLVEVLEGMTSNTVFRRRFSHDRPDPESGPSDELWLEYSCSRLMGTGGGSQENGMLVIIADATSRILAERHLKCLRDLATGMLDAKDRTDVCVRAARLMSENPRLIPWAEFHLVENDEIIRVATTQEQSPAPPDESELRQAIATGRPTIVHADTGVIDLRNLDQAEGRQVPGGTGRPDIAYLAPLGFESVSGVFIAGLNANPQLDPVYGAFLDLCAKAISAAMDAAARHSEELRTQLNISTTLQRAMLLPATNSPTVAARYVPATGGLVVGGDWYDVIDLGNGLQALTVGDCVGHGLGAAATMGQLRSASRALLLEGNSPAHVLQAMDLFASAIDGLASTMVCAILDPTNQQIAYSSAGHPPGLLLGKGRSAWLNQASGTPLGVRFDERTEAITQLSDKDLVFFYSDGLIERRRQPLELGLKRLRSLAEQHWADPVQTFADTMLERLTADGAADDVVLVAARTHTT